MTFHDRDLNAVFITVTTAGRRLGWPLLLLCRIRLSYPARVFSFPTRRPVPRTKRLGNKKLHK